MSKLIKEENKETPSSPSCKKKFSEYYDFKKKKYGIGFYFFYMLFYSILIYEGFKFAIEDVMFGEDLLSRIILGSSIILGLSVLILMIYQIKNNNFKLLFFLVKGILSIIFTNIGILLILKETFIITGFEIFDIFLYSVFISFSLSVFSWLIIRILSIKKCKVNDGK